MRKGNGLKAVYQTAKISMETTGCGCLGAILAMDSLIHIGQSNIRSKCTI